MLRSQQRSQASTSIITGSDRLLFHFFPCFRLETHQFSREFVTSNETILLRELGIY